MKIINKLKKIVAYSNSQVIYKNRIENNRIFFLKCLLFYLQKFSRKHSGKTQNIFVILNFHALDFLILKIKEFGAIFFVYFQIDVPEDKNHSPGYAYEGAACRLNVLRTMRNLRLQQLVNEVSNCAIS